jgi:hypothetical protein
MGGKHYNIVNFCGANGVMEDVLKAHSPEEGKKDVKL